MVILKSDTWIFIPKSDNLQRIFPKKMILVILEDSDFELIKSNI